MTFSLGIDIGGTKMIFWDRLHPDGIRFPTGPDFNAQKLRTRINDYLKTCSEKPESIGIAFPGLVRNASEVVICGDVPGLNGLKADDLYLPQIPVRFINDVNAATLFAKTQYRSNSLAMVMVGTGIGMGITVRDNLLMGVKGWAGELGSIVFPTTDGRPKTLDELAGGKALLEQIGLPADSLHNRLAQEEAETMALVHDAGVALGMGLSMVLHLFNPDVLVLGGGTLSFRGYTSAAIATLRKFTLPPILNSCSIHTPKGAADWAAKGAHFFSLHPATEV
ncbi:MAG TPA: ROK family protein [Rhodothermales bacterium]|nr:ROK family protein [Rhodothermales bacterium]HRR07797.1 ROK family protein [Rhodothermales bacterium]